jgi:Flp pilus assembly protein TadG
VEYAFVVILFLSLLFGISGFGHALFLYHHLNNASREATRYASVRGSDCSNDGSCTSGNSASGISGATTVADVQQYVKNITPASINANQLVITVCGVSDTTSGTACTSGEPQICTVAVSGLGPTPNKPGCTVTVQVAYPYSFIFPLIKTAPINMSSTSEMVIVH